MKDGPRYVILLICPCDDCTTKQFSNVSWCEDDSGIYLRFFGRVLNSNDIVFVKMSTGDKERTTNMTIHCLVYCLYTSSPQEERYCTYWNDSNSIKVARFSYGYYFYGWGLLTFINAGGFVESNLKGNLDDLEMIRS
ncbi:hypothetical protein RF11_14172 [Thelohanellus kitauei]|uniref:Uncharacterized protein n=1 Tax=Thelohanellus kitauei TaxID=669202 RepID=A0A0C2NE43_THEKT|nr:hypothetical protein RF11_14172 [Thelohanellus kitauei]